MSLAPITGELSLMERVPFPWSQNVLATGPKNNKNYSRTNARALISRQVHENNWHGVGFHAGDRGTASSLMTNEANGTNSVQWSRVG